MKPYSKILAVWRVESGKRGGGMQVVAKHMSKEVIANSWPCRQRRSRSCLVRRANTDASELQAACRPGWPLALPQNPRQPRLLGRGSVHDSLLAAGVAPLAFGGSGRKDQADFMGSWAPLGCLLVHTPRSFPRHLPSTDNILPFFCLFLLKSSIHDQ